MAAILTPTGTALQQEVVDYMQGLLTGDNPNKLRAFTLFFDSESPRTYFLPNAVIINKGFNPPAVNRDVKKLIRLDSVAWVTYQDANDMVGAYKQTNGNHWNTT